MFCGKYEASSPTETEEAPLWVKDIYAGLHAGSELGREPSAAGSSTHSPTELHKHCRPKAPGCVGTRDGGYLVTKGKPSSQGLFTGCLINDSGDLRTHTTAVSARAESFSHSSSADMVVHRDKKYISMQCQDIVY